jgi:hypothetical protein
MKRLQNHSIGVDQGDTVLFSDFEDDGEMWSGIGPRKSLTEVRFAESFRSAPTVQVFLTMWDMDTGTNARGDLQAEDITPEGFKIAFRTWGDTRVARVRAGWSAIGELRHADDWDLY